MQEEEKVAFHADWTFKRVRGHFFARKKFMLLLLLLLFVEEFVVVTWWWCCCLGRRSSWWSPGKWGCCSWMMRKIERGCCSGGGGGGDLLQLPDSVWDMPGNYYLEGLTSDFTRAHQLDYICLRTLNLLEVDFFNLYFGPEKLERMVGSTNAYVEDHIDNHSSYQTTVAHVLLWHSMSFFRKKKNCRLCHVLLGQRTGTRIFCSVSKDFIDQEF